MIRTFTLSLLMLCLLSPFSQADNPKATLNTNLGAIIIELYPQKAPITVANFIRYSREGFYNNTIFHRVIPNFVVQGGGYTPKHVKKDTHAPIKNESNKGLKNMRWTLSMARLTAPNSATSQFFINLTDNHYLNTQKSKAGYAVFAKVIDGTDVVKSIVEKPRGKFRTDAPNTPIRILSVHLDIPSDEKPDTQVLTATRVSQ